MSVFERKEDVIDQTGVSDSIGAIKPTKKRYFILFIFIVLSAIKSFQWIFFAAITNVIAKFYRVDNVAVNWTTVIFMVTFLILALPISWLMERIGLRNSMLIGGIGTTLGVGIKCFSCQPDRFYLAIIGHILIGIVEPFFYCSYSQLSLTWFPDNQVSLATSIGILGDTMGVALGFILPSLMVGDDLDDEPRIQKGLFNLSLGLAILSSLNTLLVILFFEDQPKYAPGIARYKQLEAQQQQLQTRHNNNNNNSSSSNNNNNNNSKSTNEKNVVKPNFDVKQMREFLLTLIDFLRNRDFNLTQIGFGVNFGTGSAIHTLLNQIITSDPELKYPDPISVVGNAGLLLIVTGMFGSIVCGYLLDRWHSYKAITILAYLLSLTSMAVLSACLNLSDPLILYINAATLGFFLTGYSCCSIEYAVEVTYPKSEQVSLTLMQLWAQVFGIAITFIGSITIDRFGSVPGCWFLCASLAIGFLATCATRSDYKRQAAINSGICPETSNTPRPQRIET